MSRRSKYCILALFLGGIGMHKFYINRCVHGLVFLLLCWTFIPAILSFLEGIIVCCISDNTFNEHYNLGEEVSNTYISELSQLKTLKDNGVITEDEFEAKKKSILFK